MDASTLKGYRSIILNTLIAALGVVAAADWITILPPQYGWAGVAIAGLANLVMRWFTSTPIGVK